MVCGRLISKFLINGVRGAWAANNKGADAGYPNLDYDSSVTVWVWLLEWACMDNG